MLKIVSGGQTGVDRTALDLAIEMGIDYGGWCPLGRRAEDGVIPQRYQLNETDSRNYAVRTRQNIIDSDGTLVFFSGTPTGGTALTIGLAKKKSKHLLCVDVDGDADGLGKEIANWVRANSLTVLNVAGPRLSSSPELPDRMRPILKRAIDLLTTVG
jgi:hypothetical protein